MGRSEPFHIHAVNREPCLAPFEIWQNTLNSTPAGRRVMRFAQIKPGAECTFK
jgi:hypothetical protein